MAKKKQPKNKVSTKTQAQPRFVPVLVYFISVILLTLSVVQLLERQHLTTGQAVLPEANLVLTQDMAVPEETKPDTVQYSVAADQPRSIIIESINSSGLIQKVGINSNKAITAPSNVNFAGWYTGSVKPGASGLSIIDGHVSGKYSDGIFKNLNKLKPGDKFEVEYGDKNLRGFEVVETKTLPETESAAYLLTKRGDIERQLNLITCGGKFNKNTQLYDDRVIVVAKATN